ncbi:MAG: dihydroneopterin aldolase [Bacteroidetes bacterium]|nr:dihydroneopterin aldolase [Bacteroidota bacterium]
MKNHISVHGIKLYAYHGCLTEEAKIGGNYIVNVDIETDFKSAALSDELTDTIDYCVIYEICKKEMGVKSKLIEHVGQRIFNTIKLTFLTVKKLRVKVIKQLPPMNGNVDEVSITIED